ncbi:hypothetical protein [Altericista sp. CCNU0014]
MSNEVPTEVSPSPEPETAQAKEVVESRQVLKTSKNIASDVLSVLKFM